MQDKIKKETLIKISEQEHKDYHKKLIYIFILIMIILFGGATFYHYFEQWRYLDALYFSASTITTVGYGDFTPRTDPGKIFTIFYLFTGVSIGLYGLSLMASHFVEVREEFWLKKSSNISYPMNIVGKIKKFFSFDSKRLVSSYEYSRKK